MADDMTPEPELIERLRARIEELTRQRDDARAKRNRARKQVEALTRERDEAREVALREVQETVIAERDKARSERPAGHSGRAWEELTKDDMFYEGFETACAGILDCLATLAQEDPAHGR